MHQKCVGIVFAREAASDGDEGKCEQSRTGFRVRVQKQTENRRLQESRLNDREAGPVHGADGLGGDRLSNRKS